MNFMDRIRAPLLRMGPRKLMRFVWVYYAILAFLLVGELVVWWAYPDRAEFSVSRTLIVILLLAATVHLHVLLRRLERRGAADRPDAD